MYVKNVYGFFNIRDEQELIEYRKNNGIILNWEDEVDFNIARVVKYLDVYPNNVNQDLFKDKLIYNEKNTYLNQDFVDKNIEPNKRYYYSVFYYKYYYNSLTVKDEDGRVYELYIDNYKLKYRKTKSQYNRYTIRDGNEYYEFKIVEGNVVIEKSEQNKNYKLILPDLDYKNTYDIQIQNGAIILVENNFQMIYIGKKDIVNYDMCNINIKWIDPDNFDKIQIKRYDNKNNCKLIKEYGIDEKNKYQLSYFSDNTVKPNVQYTYKFFVYNETGVNDGTCYILGKSKTDFLNIKINGGNYPKEVWNISLNNMKNKVYLNWNDPVNKYWLYTRVVRKKGGPVKNPEDGITICKNYNRHYYQKHSFVDSVAKEDIYYYEFYSYDLFGNYYKYSTVERGMPYIEFPEVT